MSTDHQRGRAAPSPLGAFEAVTIDFDGTLAQLGPRPRGLWRAWLSHREIIDAWRREVEAARGRRSADLPAHIRRGVARATGREEAAVAEVLHEVIGGTWSQLFGPQHVPEAVRQLLAGCAHLGLPVAVVSDHPSLTRTARLSLPGLHTVVDCTRLGALKPLPDGLLSAAAQLGCAPSRLLHVGDRWDTDAAAAAAAGATFLHVDDLGSFLGP